MEKVFDILLIEDNPSDIKLTLKAFEKMNLANRVFVVTDGEQALSVFYQKEKFSDKGIINPKVILLDLKLPKVDGHEVLKELKSNEKTKIIPVVVLTSSDDESDILKSYKLGANSYIVKPVDYEKFVKTVTELGIYWLFFNTISKFSL